MISYPFSSNQVKRASIFTLGCRLNQAESQNIKEKLVNNGYILVPFGEKADLGIINTCTVTSLADAKCRQVIRKFIKSNPTAFIAVIGCYSQMAANDISNIPGVDLILGNQEKLSILDYVDMGKNDRPLIIRDKINKEDFSMSFVGDIPFNKRANLKVQEGCDFMCSFCIIPFARGRARSRDFDNLVAEAKSLVCRGVREIVLTGVNIGTYDNNKKNITSIVDNLNKISGLDRIRISSIEPTTIPLALLDRMADSSHSLLPFLHIPLQAGSNKILEKMRRKYTVQEFSDFINLAQKKVNDICIGTDIMVGFPGESDDDFDQTCQLFNSNPFSYCHVFPYSEREGALAAKWNESIIPQNVRQKRSAILRRLSEEKRYKYYSRYVGKKVEVLFEDKRDGSWPGYTPNYMRVVTSSTQDLTNKIMNVKLTEITHHFLMGVLTDA